MLSTAFTCLRSVISRRGFTYSQKKTNQYTHKSSKIWTHNFLSVTRMCSISDWKFHLLFSNEPDYNGLTAGSYHKEGHNNTENTHLFYNISPFLNNISPFIIFWLVKSKTELKHWYFEVMLLVSKNMCTKKKKKEYNTLETVLKCFKTEPLTRNHWTHPEVCILEH